MSFWSIPAYWNSEESQGGEVLLDSLIFIFCLEPLPLSSRIENEERVCVSPVAHRAP